MTKKYLRHQKTLVDAFFHARDQQLLDAFHERTEKMDRRAQLAAVSGISDEAVLDRLIELEIGPEALAAIEVVPLVAVAWSDGEIQPDERVVILQAAADAGIAPQDGRYPMMEHWLENRPGSELLKAWTHYISVLCQDLEPEEVERLKRTVLAPAEQVARAAGGFLGFGDKVSAAERIVLRKLEQAFA